MLNFLSVKNDHQINVTRARENIIPQKQVKKMLKHVWEDLYKTIAPTIGPSGGNTLITEPFAQTPIFPTKDGFQVMNNHMYDDIPYESIYRIIRDLSGRMNQELGDGTTSVVLCGKDFYFRIIKYIEKHKEITPYGAKKILDCVLEKLAYHLKDKYVQSALLFSRELKYEIYKKVATISANNDSTIGDRVAKAYYESNSDYAFIDIQMSDNKDDVSELNLGFEINSGYILRHMANNADGIFTDYTDPLYLLIDGPIIKDDVKILENYINWACVAMKRPFVIIASEFCKEAMDLFTSCRTGIKVGDKLLKLPILGIIVNTSNEYGVARMGDLEVALGARSLKTDTGRLQNAPKTEEEFILMCGRSDHINCAPYYTRIKGGGGLETEKTARIEELKKVIESYGDVQRHGLEAASKLETIKKRMGMLKGEMHCIKVGGDSYKEKKNRMLIYEDAVAAVKSCVEHGFTLGGNVSISDCISKNKESIIDEVYEMLTDENVTFNVMIGRTEHKLKKIIRSFLEIISSSSRAAFLEVFKNATNDKRFIDNVFSILSCTDKDLFMTYNLIKDRYESMYIKGEHFDSIQTDKDVPDLIVPGNTDIEILKSVFCIVGMFITSNQLLTVHLRKDNKV